VRYFEYFPTLEYSSTGTIDTNLLTDITVRAKFKSLAKENAFIYYPYIIKEGQRPDILSHLYYGRSEYVWIILLANDIVDPLYEWPLNYFEFKSFIIDKYGSIESASTTTHHYELVDGGYEIDQTTYDATAVVDRKIVTQYDYETLLNEDKRQIRLLDSQYIVQITTEFERLFING